MSSTDIQAIAPGVFELERGESGAETQVKAGLTHFEIQKILLQFNALSMFGLYLREEIVRMFEQLLCEVCPRVSNFFRPIFYLSSSSSYFFQNLLNFPIRFSNNGVPINLISSKWSILRIHRKKNPSKQDVAFRGKTN